MEGDGVVINEHCFSFDEILIIFLYHNAKALNYSDICCWLGSDYCAYTYPINWMTDFLFGKYYHRISGDSLAFWAPKVPQFHEAIWHSIAFDQTSNVDYTRDDTIEIEQHNSRGFGFADCIQHIACCPGSGPINSNGNRRPNAYNLQRARDPFFFIWGNRLFYKSYSFTG